MMMSSARSSRWSMSTILSESSDPPRMARNGLRGWYRNVWKKCSSFMSWKPAALAGKSIPTTELCVVWQVSNESLMKMSPSLLSDCLWMVKVKLIPRQISGDGNNAGDFMTNLIRRWQE